MGFKKGYCINFSVGFEIKYGAVVYSVIFIIETGYNFKRDNIFVSLLFILKISLSLCNNSFLLFLFFYFFFSLLGFGVGDKRSLLYTSKVKKFPFSNFCLFFFSLGEGSNIK